MPKKSTKPFVRKTKGFSNSNSRWQTASFQIVNEAGIHTRPAAAFVKCAQQFPAEIKIYKGRESANGKSILNLLALGIEKGTTITIKTKGLQAEEALRALGTLIREGFYE